MKMDSDKPKRVNGMELTFSNDSGYVFSNRTMSEAKTVINNTRKAMRLAIEPLSVVSITIQFGFGRTIIGKPKSKIHLIKKLFVRPRLAEFTQNKHSER